MERKMPPECSAGAPHEWSERWRHLTDSRLQTQPRRLRGSNKAFWNPAGTGLVVRVWGISFRPPVPTLFFQICSF